jgi:hypothetical protein
LWGFGVVFQILSFFFLVLASFVLLARHLLSPSSYRLNEYETNQAAAVRPKKEKKEWMTDDRSSNAAQAATEQQRAGVCDSKLKEVRATGARQYTT